MKWVNNIKNAHLVSTLVWKSHLFQLWPGLRYGLGTLTNSMDDLIECTHRIEVELLPLLGVNRHIPWEWRILPQAYGGVGLLHLPTKQFILCTNLFLQYYKDSSIIGNKLQCLLLLLQLQIGTNMNPLQIDYNKWAYLAPSSWVTCFWELIYLDPEISLYTN
jgi:hypothetical protein